MTTCNPNNPDIWLTSCVLFEVAPHVIFLLSLRFARDVRWNGNIGGGGVCARVKDTTHTITISHMSWLFSNWLSKFCEFFGLKTCWMTERERRLK